jgi:hypothetical protein
MPKHLHIALAIFIIALLASCGDDRCEGSLTVVNTIPDITVAVGDTVYVDLTNPRIFERPPNNAISYAVSQLSGFLLVQVLQMQNANDNERATLIRIIGKSSGDAKMLVEAGAGCLVNETTFNITVQ